MARHLFWMVVHSFHETNERVGRIEGGREIN
jgi:hypothetical protein